MKWPDFGYGLKPTEEEDAYDLYPSVAPGSEQAWQSGCAGASRTPGVPSGRG